MSSKRVAKVSRFPMAGPNDISLIRQALEQGQIDARNIIAVLGKTEGNGCVNDFTRGFAVQSLQLLFADFLEPEAASSICTVISGGTEGALSPHWLIFEQGESSEEHDDEPAMAMGAYITADLTPNQVGRRAQISAVAAGVQVAMARAGIESPDDVHFVQIKCPLLTVDRVLAAGGADQVATTDTLKSMGLSRGASALGVALALGEVDESQLSDACIGADHRLYSTRASCSAGVELMGCEILVLGQSRHWTGPLRVGHAQMSDCVDVEPVKDLLSGLGLPATKQLRATNAEQVLAVLVKAEASKSGLVRGARHTMLDDSDVSSTRHARAFVGGALASVFGHTELFVSGGAEHQGPDGGGPCAVIVRTG